jgi:hypothetical protein
MLGLISAIGSDGLMVRVAEIVLIGPPSFVGNRYKLSVAPNRNGWWSMPTLYPSTVDINLFCTKGGKMEHSGNMNAIENDQPLSRVNYFTGQILTTEDFQAEQRYWIEKHRRHNRSLHGSGVVWGLTASVSVDPGNSTPRVTVSPGLAIDRCGDEILVPAAQQAELPDSEADREIWVKLCYAETPSGMAPLPGSPGAGESQAATRIVEGFYALPGIVPWGRW